MADSYKFGRFKVNRGGVAATLKTGAVRAWVGETVDSIASAANAQAEGRRSTIGGKTRGILMKRDPSAFGSHPYEGVVKTGSFDTLGVVRPATIEGAYDSNQHHTLDSYRH